MARYPEPARRIAGQDPSPRMRPVPQNPPPARRPRRGPAPLRTSELILLATIASFVLVAAIQAVILVAGDLAKH